MGSEALHARHNVNALIADSPADFARNVVGLLNDPSMRSRLGSAGARTARELYSWEAKAGEFEDLLVEVAEAGRAG
jgi:glycosyltransferase involved in cell wall biosynthesis